MPEDMINCGWYVTLLVDVLGQREDILSMPSLPENKEKKSAYIQALKDSAGRVDFVRQSISKFFNRFLDESSFITHSKPTDEQLEQYKILNQCPISTQMFSDTVIAYSPISTSTKPRRIITKSVYAMIFSAASILIHSLSNEVALRGTIDVDEALELHKNDIYGRALLKVDYLEKNIAQWPRIVVGEGLMQFLYQMRRTPCNDLVDQMNHKVAETCLSIIAPDVDGMPIIDYLGDVFQKTLGSTNQRSTIEAGLAFARREHERFSRSGNYKLALRYDILRQYYEERMVADTKRT